MFVKIIQLLLTLTADRAMYNVPRGQNITLALKTAATGPAESLSIQFLTDVYGQVKLNSLPPGYFS